MENFTYQELKLIKWAINTEIENREQNPFATPEITKEFKVLRDKVDNLIRYIRRTT